VTAPADTLRALMRDGPAVGTFLKLPRREVVDLLALAGFDFVICDLEHAQMTEGDAQTVIAAGRGADLPVIVRIPDNDRGLVNRLLEAGAAGIQLSRARAVEMRDLLDQTRFPPHGTRSIGLAHPGAAYGRVPVPEYLDFAGTPLLVGQIETSDYSHLLDETVAHSDVVFIGPVDLSVALGHPMDLASPPVSAALRQISEVAVRLGTPMGIFTADLEAARRAIADGYRFIAISGDITMLRDQAATLVAELIPNRNGLEPA
jgi:2-keto-3-deoxy-L-rhamnonate aldolase RhmA